MLETLFSSRIRAKLLTTLFLSPGERRNVRELSKILKENYSAVWKELKHLEEVGILTNERKGNAKTYWVNPGCSIVPELRSIVLKTEGIGGVIQKKLTQLGDIRKAFIYGSFAAGTADMTSDIDLLVIGELNLEDFSGSISETEKELNRPINYVIFSEKEWNDKLASEDPFATNVDRSEKIMLVGEENAI